MNYRTLLSMSRTSAVLIALAAALAGPRWTRAAESTDATIQSIWIDATNVVVKVTVAPFCRRVYLEQRDRFGGGTWKPVLVTSVPSGSDEPVELELRAPQSEGMAFLRVRGDSSTPLPQSLYSGTNDFVQVGAPTGGAFDSRDATTGVAPSESGDTAARDVVESDIWKVAGDILYFFNNHRGLQVIDVARPDEPVLTGSYSLPAAGEQMYLIGTNQVVLLAQDRCGGWSGQAQSAVILIDVVNGIPVEAAKIPVEGVIMESRMVGTALYLVANRYRPMLNSVSGEWEWGSQVSSYDLANFAEPAARDMAWVGGYSNPIYATDQFLFVATMYENGAWLPDYSARIHIFDIASPDGAMVKKSVLNVSGRVNDKFKMNLDGDVFAVVTENSMNTQVTRLETFSLQDAAKPAPLGQLVIIERERLFATRFDGKTLYAVTFFLIDPLWVIDLSNPAAPKKVGELEIPGWSTYIRPLGNQLLTVGIDNTDGKRRTSVQLFDVSVLSNPTLLSKVLLGAEYSYSEANYDEKAFGVIPEEELILVPFSTWGPDGYTQGVQLIDLKPDGLVKRGVIHQLFGPRRTTSHRDRILSISGRELLTVNAANRDEPIVVKNTPLAWPVDRVIAHGSFLIELGESWDAPNAIRVVRKETPERIEKQIDLDRTQILGLEKRDGRLFVFRGQPTTYVWPQVYNPTNWAPISTNKGFTELRVYDLTQLPELPLLGESTAELSNNQGWLSQYEPLWPSANTLVWAMDNTSGYWGPWRNWVEDGPVGIAADSSVGRGWGASIWWGGGGNHYVAYDVTSAAAPVLLSELSVPSTNNWGFGRSFGVGPLIYTSHRTSEYMKDLLPPPYVYSQWDGSQYVLVTNQPGPGVWVERHYLDVVDYTDARQPAYRGPVSIPGTLSGVGAHGELLYTQSYRRSTNYWNWSQWVDANAYDGLAVYHIDSIPLPMEYPSPVLVADGWLYMGRPKTTNSPARLEVWGLNQEGKLARANEVALDQPLVQLNGVGGVLAAQAQGEGVVIFDLSSPTAPQVIGRGGEQSCLGFNLAGGVVENDAFWMPANTYGVIKINLTRPAPEP